MSGELFEIDAFNLKVARTLDLDEASKGLVDHSTMDHSKMDHSNMDMKKEEKKAEPNGSFKNGP